MSINSFVISDPLYSQQWHLALIGQLGFGSSSTQFDGLERVWADYRGGDVDVGIWDDGVQANHWDLNANYNSDLHVQVGRRLNDGQPLTNSDGHGTAVAGLIAAENNGQGGVGVAFEADITSVRIFGGRDDINTNYNRYLRTLNDLDNFDVTNHSYGAFPSFGLFRDVEKFERSAERGRDGLGTINFKSAGNDNVHGGGDSLDASRFTVSVAALDAQGQVASYSTYGAHILVSAPAGSVTTDRLGNNAGYNGLLDGDYTDQFGGTSAAGPVSAGVATLMLSANADLGWRDVQNILALSSIGTGSIYGGSTSHENFGWSWNGAENWNGGGMHFSEDYGYGMVNAFNAVRMAEVWFLFADTAQTSANETEATSGHVNANAAIGDLSSLSFSFSVSGQIEVEHVSVEISLTHSYFPDLLIQIQSAEGTILTLYDGSTGNGSLADGTFTFTFGADGFHGELSEGTWTVLITDRFASDSGTLHSVNLTAFGATVDTDDVYHFTDEIFTLLDQAGHAGRAALSDGNGGEDWINAAAMVRDFDLNLGRNTDSTSGGVTFLSIDGTSDIENAVAGDGNDMLTGNALNNILHGMRGDDDLYGLAGDDILAGGLGDDMIVGGGDFDICILDVNFVDCTVTYDFDLERFTVQSAATGVDTISEVELFRFLDGDYDTSAWTVPDETAPVLDSVSPTSSDTGVDPTDDLTISFDENVQAGSGNITIWYADGTEFAVISVSDSSQVSFSDNQIVINPDADLDVDESYYVTIDAGAVEDLSGNDFGGISDDSTFEFSVASVTTNVITGSNRRDRLNGTSEDDTIYGLSGNDRISGGNGSDWLFGGLGKDVLGGGGGVDYFVFDTLLSRNNQDRISDFKVGEDVVVLDQLIFTALSAGSLDASEFALGKKASDGDDHILYDERRGNLYYDADGAGGQGAQIIAKVGRRLDLSEDDFLII